jgi:hypothetical protein
MSRRNVERRKSAKPAKTRENRVEGGFPMPRAALQKPTMGI